MGARGVSFGMLLLSILIAQQASSALQNSNELSFAHYPVRKFFKGKPAPVRLKGARARRFRTRLREDSRLGPNFAGRYTVVFWGCGSGCAETAIVDAYNGRVFWVPLDWSDIPDDASVADNRNFRMNSRLLVLTRSNYDKHATYTEYDYLMTTNGLRLLRKLSVDPSQ